MYIVDVVVDGSVCDTGYCRGLDPKQSVTLDAGITLYIVSQKWNQGWNIIIIARLVARIKWWKKYAVEQPLQNGRCAHIWIDRIDSYGRIWCYVETSTEVIRKQSGSVTTVAVAYHCKPIL